jgi:drug/metabolite transporter (DMT)-like permease
MNTRAGLGLGILGVLIFSLTLPMTRLAVGSPEAPQMSGLFVATGRAVVAALLSALFLWFTRAPWPQRRHGWPLLMVALGVVLGFPLCTSMAMRHVQAVHASVILGLLPLTTAAMGAWLHRQRPSLGFWLCAGAGAALVVVYALLHAGQGPLRLEAADALLLVAMLFAALGYGYGAQLSAHMRAEHVICWALLIALPLTLPLALLSWPSVPITPVAWSGFAYVAVFSMWLGFFAWYRGLALGGTVRVSQVQLLQPFMSMVFAIPLLGEALDGLSVMFALSVIATVVLGRKMPIHTAHKP